MIKQLATSMLMAIGVLSGSLYSPVANPVDSVPVSEGFNVIALTESAFSMSCIAWRPTGVCFWLRCIGWKCSITTSLRSRHYLPDVVVSIYQDPENAPWRELRFFSNASAQLLQSGATGSKAESGRGRNNTGVVTRMADVVGNPASTILGQILNSAGIGCRGQVTPFRPYFMSGVDPLGWRYPYMDMLNIEGMIPGRREIGFRDDGDDSWMWSGRWGHLYPRSGSIIQQDHFKASATIAQRAISIVTDPGRPLFLRSELPANRQVSRGVWPPGPAEEWSSHNGKWQMVYPKVDSECAIFGDNEVYTSEESLADYRSDSGAYGWVFWRRWNCCPPRGLFLISINIED